MFITILFINVPEIMSESSFLELSILLISLPQLDYFANAVRFLKK